MKLGKQILRILGYEYLSDIKINKRWKEPREIKLLNKLLYYAKYGQYESEIVIKGKNNMLIDGYTTYILEREKGKKIVKVKRV